MRGVGVAVPALVRITARRRLCVLCSGGRCALRWPWPVLMRPIGAAPAVGLHFGGQGSRQAV